MTDFLRILKHLLPRGKAWRVTIDKTLRRYLKGVADGVGPSVKQFIDNVWLDIFPQTTREIDQWEGQWALPAAGLTTQERRDRLDAAWKALGGQSPRYIQDTLRARGFDVYVHEWWVPGTEPAVGAKNCVTPRSPLAYLRREFSGIDVQVECGEALAQCGEAFAEAGNTTNARGYPLVNLVLQTAPDLLTLCGEARMDAGEAEAICGNYTEFRTKYREYVVPSDVSKWPYFLYIGAENIDDIAQIDPKRREEFEALCLKICPTQQWLGILVEYV